MSYTKRAVRAFTLVFVINIIAAFLGYLARVVLARNLTVAEYGLFFSIFTLINFLGAFIGLGMGESLVKYIPEFLVKKEYHKIKNAVILVILASLATFILLGILLSIFSGFLGELYFKNPFATPVLFLFIIIMLLISFKGILRTVFQAFQDMKLFALMYLLENLFLLILFLFLFKLKKDIFIASYVYVLANLFIIIIFLPLFFRAFTSFKHKAFIDKDVFKKMFRFGILVIASNVGGIIILYTDTLLLTFFRSLEEVGIYNVVVPTVMIIQFFPSSIASVIFPMVSELWARKKKAYLAQGLKMLYQYSFVIMIPSVLIALSFSQTILRLMFGQAYAGGGLAMQVLLIAIIFLGLQAITSTILAAIGQPAINTKILAQGAVINLVLNILIIPRLGIVGAALTSLLSYFYIALRCMLELKRFIRVDIPWLSWLKTLFAGLIMLVAIFFLKKQLGSNH